MTAPVAPPVAPEGASKIDAPTTPPKPDSKTLEAARQFETIFLRHVLSSLEKTTQLAGKGGSVASGSAYSSMVVDAVADAVSSSGGIGLADVIAKALMEGSAQTKK